MSNTTSNKLFQQWPGVLAVPDTWGQGTWDLEVPDRDTGLDLVGLGRLQQDQGTADLELLALDTGQVLGMGQVLDTERVSLAIKQYGGVPMVFVKPRSGCGVRIGCLFSSSRT